MKKKGLIALRIGALLFGIVGLIMIIVDMLSESAPGWMLPAALGCISIGTIINAVHMRM
ncbi:MAG: hypothetical protein IKR73_07075 [Oscillospiraceae bacterium]|nr:hypothetical protein [Oscillospiraceae bacterium]